MAAAASAAYAMEDDLNDPVEFPPEVFQVIILERNLLYNRPDYVCREVTEVTQDAIFWRVRCLGPEGGEHRYIIEKSESLTTLKY